MLCKEFLLFEKVSRMINPFGSLSISFSASCSVNSKSLFVSDHTIRMPSSCFYMKSLAVSRIVWTRGLLFCVLLRSSFDNSLNSTMKFEKSSCEFRSVFYRMASCEVRTSDISVRVNLSPSLNSSFFCSSLLSFSDSWT